MKTTVDSFTAYSVAGEGMDSLSNDSGFAGGGALGLVAPPLLCEAVLSYLPLSKHHLTAPCRGAKAVSKLNRLLFAVCDYPCSRRRSVNTRTDARRNISEGGRYARSVVLAIETTSVATEKG